MKTQSGQVVIGGRVVIGFSFASDWLREWRKISGPITERSEAKLKQSRVTYNTITLGPLLKGSLHTEESSRWNRQ